MRDPDGYGRELKLGERVVVAMSGGVDSSVAAALLVEQGYDVVGAMLRLWVEPGPAAGNKCCSLEAMYDARAVADRLGIPFYVLNAEEPFKAAVVDFFLDEHRAGRTPNPCLACNRRIRFGYLLKYAQSLGARYLATGHYAQVRTGPGGLFELWRGADRGKDQSYVLHVLGQRELGAALFPVGGFTKPEVRALAAARGLPTASRADSQDLCFVGDGDYGRFLADWAPETVTPGPIVDRQGRELGRHRGLARYTIGQRSGLGIAAAQPLYVLEVDRERNTLVVGTAAELGCDRFVAGPVNWLAGEPPSGAFECEVQIRYRARPARARVALLSDGAAEVQLEAPLRDVTPGQGAVFYDGDGDRCLGGGNILKGLFTTRATSC